MNKTLFLLLNANYYWLLIHQILLKNLKELEDDGSFVHITPTISSSVRKWKHGIYTTHRLHAVYQYNLTKSSNLPKTGSLVHAWKCVIFTVDKHFIVD